MYYNRPELPKKETRKRIELYVRDTHKQEIIEWANQIPDNSVLDFDIDDHTLYYYITIPNLKYDEEYAIYEQKLAAYNRHLEDEKEKKKSIENKLATLLIREPDIINLLLKKHGLA